MTVKQALADYALRTQARASELERWGKTLMMIYRHVGDRTTMKELAIKCYKHRDNLRAVGMHEQSRNAAAFGAYVDSLVFNEEVGHDDYEERGNGIAF